MKNICQYRKKLVLLHLEIGTADLGFSRESRRLRAP